MLPEDDYCRPSGLSIHPLDGLLPLLPPPLRTVKEGLTEMMCLDDLGKASVDGKALYLF